MELNSLDRLLVLFLDSQHQQSLKCIVRDEEKSGNSSTCREKSDCRFDKTTKWLPILSNSRRKGKKRTVISTCYSA
ncbi:unnamed protein product [Urochloa humidicola]